MKYRKFNAAFGCMVFLLLLTMLAACSSNGPNAGSAGNKENATAEPDNSQPSNGEEAGGEVGDGGMEGDEQAATRTITDYAGRTVEIPMIPKKIIYIGSTPGDFLAVGTKPIGAALSVISTQVIYHSELAGIEDIGDNETNLEKILALEPDLIVTDGANSPEHLEALSKIAATVSFDSSVPMYERFRFIADVIDKKEEAESWIAAYEEKAKATIERLDIHNSETATVLLLLGKQLYVMGKRGIAVTLYDVLDFTPAPKVQEIIGQSERFVTISEEVLPDYIGDWLFLLSNNAEETLEAKQALLDSTVWKTIPTVKNGQVFTMESKWNFDDPITREKFLDELPRIMNK
ncbi:hypothetical protein EBB07_10460 [Paenibacillaceae bacterium]|nr:hypothetical protein EBB07_10460 [Paenibacillaceae bacterium]